MSAEEEGLEALVARYLEEKKRTPDLGAVSFVARYPERAPELLEVLQGMELMEHAAAAFGAEQARSAPASSHAATDRRPGPPGIDFVDEVLAGLGEPQGSPRYSLEDELARGGQGAVVAAWDRALRRQVAMKIALVSSPTGDPADTRSLGRFLEEAHVTAQLDHPGIVPVHELGLNAARQAYFTMKLVKGRDLHAIFELVRSGAEGWTQTRALSVLLKVCEAMAYAHAKGVIHRDLKPSNVMVGKFGEVYVMDWGLARVQGCEDRKDLRLRHEARSEIHSLRSTGAAEQDSPLVTMDGDVLGTPAYMAPEQACGELAALGAHSDVYALGAMLYQLLTGTMPYVTPGSKLGNRAILRLAQQGPPLPPHTLAPDIPAELTAICEKAMARDIAARYADMGELAEDLRAYLEQRVVRAYEAGALAELRKWIARNRGLAASLTATILFALIGLAGVGFVQAEGKRTANRERDNTRRERDNVLRLSAVQELVELRSLADELWPLGPQNHVAYREWLARARVLVSGLEPHPDGEDIGHRKRLAQLEARALPYSSEDREADRRAHPRASELEALKARIAGLERADAVRAGRAHPEEVDIDPASLPDEAALLHWWAWVAGSNPNAETRSRARLQADSVRKGHLRAEDCEPVLNMLAWSLSGPDKNVPDQFARGLALARLGVEANPHSGALDTLAWASFASGLDNDALDASQEALDKAPPAQVQFFRASLARLRAEVEEARSGAALERARAELRDLEAELDRRRTWRFESPEDLWWHEQLVELIQGIEAFAHPETGDVTGFCEERGLGIARRLALSESLEERTLLGPEAAAKWTEAITAIALSPAYDRLRIEPQFGLLPLGPDPDSGLWEFAHLQTGQAPERNASDRLVLTEETGLIFVLLPGGTFSMGAQAGEPEGSNYDPQAAGDEGPVHAVTLSPFFLSKHEMTQGQWLRASGSNPSLFGPHNWPTGSSRTGRTADLTHPVESVSWLDCVALCRRMGCILPSEARWEYATRAGTSSIWWPGDEVESLQGVANVADTFAREQAEYWRGFEDRLDDGWIWHAPVGGGLPNPFGLHDVHGNVFEWCQDGEEPLFYARCLLEPRPDPVAGPAGEAPSTRKFRGGGFWDKALFARSANRGTGNLDSANFWLGLRPARELRGAALER